MNSRTIARVLFCAPALVVGMILVILAESPDPHLIISMFRPPGGLLRGAIASALAGFLAVYIWRRDNSLSRTQQLQVCAGLALLCMMSFDQLPMVPILIALAMCWNWVRPSAPEGPPR
jgi:hypothetical protein